MLDQPGLKQQILDVLDSTIPEALEHAMYSTYGNTSERAKENAKKFAETFKDIAHDALAEGISAAIDYYVRNAEVFGQMLLVGIPTVGSPVSHTSLPHMVQAKTMPKGLGGGSIPGPNTFIFGIQ